MLLRVAALKTQILLLAVVVALAGILISPFYTQRVLEQAALKGDQRTVISLIDLSATQDNTAGWMQGQLGELTPMVASGGPIGNFLNIGGVAQVLGGAYFHAQMTRYLTAPLVARTLTMVVRGSTNYASRSDKRLRKGSYLPELPDRYRDFSHFEFWSTNDNLPVHVVLCRKYFVTWQVCGFEGKDVITELGEDLQKFMNGQHALQNRR